jgi:hypothetical protein
MCKAITCDSTAGWQDIPNKDVMIGGDVSTCCARTCQGTGNMTGINAKFTCPTGYHKKANFNTIFGSTLSACCDINIVGKCIGNTRTVENATGHTVTAPGYTPDVVCSADHHLIANPASIAGTDHTACCAPDKCSGNTDTSDDHTCSAGHHLKPTSNSIDGKTDILCCDQTKCSGNSRSSADHTCSAGYHLKPTSNSIVGKSDMLCCNLDKCSGNADPSDDYTCVGTGAVLKTTSSAIEGKSDAVCCEIRGKCSGNTNSNDIVCPALGTFYNKKPNFAALLGTNVDDCCDKIIRWRCSGNTDSTEDVTCATGSMLKPFNDIIVIDPVTLSAQGGATVSDQQQLICCTKLSTPPPPPPPPPPLTPTPTPTPTALAGPQTCRGNADQSTDFVCNTMMFGKQDSSHMYIQDSTTIVCPAGPPLKVGSAATAKVGVMLLLVVIAAVW